MDLIVRRARLPDGRAEMDIAIKDGRIVAVEPALQAEAAREIDAAGHLVAPPFVDSHFHMDSTLTAGNPRHNESGTLLEGIRIWGELKPDLTQEKIFERAMSYCDMAVARGLLAIRSHVDVCDPRLLAVDALLEVRKQVAPYLDLQLVAFPQDGFLRAPQAKDLLAEALRRGVDVVGGIPHFERTQADGAEAVKQLCEIAAERSLPVDMHCDESDDPHARFVENLAYETRRLGLQGRVTGSHLTSMHSMDNYYFTKLIHLMVEAELKVIANPLINVTLQGRQDTYPKRRGLTRVPELMGAGLRVAMGHDCVMDPWYALGSGDMLEVAHMGAHVAHMTGRAEIEACFAAVTETPARILELEGYGLAPGCHGDLVVLEAADPVDAVRLRGARLAVVRRGRVVAESPPTAAKLDLPGRPGEVRFTGHDQPSQTP
ncbi:MAG: amidohydrolase family protein [Pseudomonadota bacterium]